MRLKTAGLTLLVTLAAAHGRSAELDGFQYDKGFKNLMPMADRAIASWPRQARRLAELMIERYGDPDRVAPDALIWLDNAPWKRTVVYRDPWRDRTGRSRAGALEQTVAYRVPQARLGELARLDLRLKADARAKEMSFRSNSEKMNFMALNLADDVANGRMTPAQAHYFAHRVVMLAASGKTSSYTGGLLFGSQRTSSASQP